MDGIRTATKTDRLSESSFFKKGSAAEKEWAILQQSHGKWVVPTWGMTRAERSDRDNAPMLFGPLNDNIVSPDMMVFGGHVVEWHEVKSKSVPSWYRILGQWEHGIDWVNACHYRRIEEVTKMPVLVVVREDVRPEDELADSKLVLETSWRTISLNDVFRLGQRRPKWPGLGGGQLWPRNAMTEVRYA